MRIGTAGAALAIMAAAGQAVGAPQVVTGPVATYWMSAATTSGFGAGGHMDRQAMMAMAMGGGPDPNAANHSLILQLGSSRAPDGGPPNAEHDPPAALGAGPMLPLISPQAAPTHEESQPGPPPQYRQPHGRMLIFWGCGEHAGPGQPFVIDFANTAGAGQQFMALGRAAGVTPMLPPSPTRNKTYGEWPNSQSRTTVGPDASLQGAHVVHGNYSPEMRFSLDANQDFLPPFSMTANEKTASGAGALGWRPVDGAKGYFATMFGGQGQGEGGGDTQVVMWTSSAAQASAFGMPEYLSDAEIARLTASHALMPASQTQCTIPAEAMAAAGRGGFFNLVAYGGESNIDFPPRPPAPQPWNIAWQVKLRYRSSTSGIVGMNLAKIMRGGQDGEAPDGDQQQQRPPPKKHGLFPPIPGFPG